jgi:hypothetical protein
VATLGDNSAEPDHLMQPFVIMRGVKSGLIKMEDLDSGTRADTVAELPDPTTEA